MLFNKYFNTPHLFMLDTTPVRHLKMRVVALGNASGVSSLNWQILRNYEDIVSQVFLLNVSLSSYLYAESSYALMLSIIC